MDNKEVEEILKEYKLSEEEHDELYDKKNMDSR